MSLSRKRGLLFATDVNKFISRFPGLEYTGTYIRCTFCNIGIAAHSAQNCKRHINCKRHVANATNQIPYWKFLYDFIFMLSVCNIPQHIVDNDNFRVFWKKYVPSWTLPSKKQLRNHLPRVQKRIEDSVQCQLKNNKIWLTVNQTRDAKRNSVVNVLVRTLNSNEPSNPFLLSSRRLQKTNPEMIVQIIKNAVEKFGIKQTQIVMLVTDRDSAMVKAGKMLKNDFPNLLHITCLLHAFHLVAENIRTSYPKVDRLISYTRKVFAKNPKRVQVFKKFCPGITLPPQPILTRCGTWLEAVLYYNKYFQNIKSFLLQLDLWESRAIEVSQQLFSDVQVETDIREISEQYTIIVEDISKLQNSKLSLADSLDIVHHLNSTLENTTGTIGLRVGELLRSILNKNPDFQKILDINQCLSGNQDCDNVKEFKFANITSLDIEHLFSKYTETFSPFRRSMSERTMEGLLMLQLYASTLRQSTLTYEL